MGHSKIREKAVGFKMAFNVFYPFKVGIFSQETQTMSTNTIFIVKLQ